MKTILYLFMGILLAGCPTCPYESQCDGNIRSICSVGIDQLVGSPSYQENECRYPNSVCVNIDDQSAICALSDEHECDESVEPLCEDGLLLSCSNGYFIAEDCKSHGNACLEVEGKLRCLLSPLTGCDPENFIPYCEEQILFNCDYGLIKAEDCSLRHPALDCIEFENEYTKQAYCG